jgi:hypothetical protein
LYQQQLITDEQYQLRKRQINSAIANETIASLKNVATEGSRIQQGLFLFEKLLAVREAFIALQAGASKTAASVPFPANIPLIAGFVAQVAGLISAIKGVAAPKVPKFAGGVIGLDGAGTSTSDSISARLSKGESVMTARATKVFAPVLANMERAVGNTPNFQLGSRRFAGGFIPSPATPALDYEAVIKRTIREVAQIPVVVMEGDMTATQDRVRRIKVKGDL